MGEKIVEELKESIRAVPDFPKKGILFRDITTLLKDGRRFKQAVEVIACGYKEKGITKVVGVEARGFIFGAAVACRIETGFVPVRKKGKLPAEVFEISYELEYATDTLQVHRDALTSKDRVLIIDDLLATGGTAGAVCRLIEKSGAKIAGIEFLIELSDLKGIEQLKGYPVHSIIKY